MGVTNVMMNNLGPVIGGHTGAGMIAIVAWQTTDRYIEILRILIVTCKSFI